MEQKKTMPKVPKFEKPDLAQQPTNDNLKMEMENFLNEIKAQSEKKVMTIPPPQPQIDQIIVAQPLAAKPVAKAQPLLKDFSSLNDKLTNIMKKKEMLNSQSTMTTTSNSTSITTKVPSALNTSTQQGNTKTLKSLSQSKEEYDPARPNDYDECRRACQEAQYYKKDPPIIEPKQTIPKVDQTTIEIEYPTQDSIKITQTAEEKALKMMERQGFKLGQGLGKNSQGMTTPLIAKKTNDSVGVIRASNLDMSKVLPQDLVMTRQFEQVSQEPTRILVLLNMVTPSQVDDNLEAEIIQELSKYGQVKQCVIYLINEDEEMAVRIFVEFAKYYSCIYNYQPERSNPWKRFQALMGGCLPPGQLFVDFTQSKALQTIY